MYNFRLGIIRELKNQGHDITIIAPMDAFSAKLTSEGFSYRHIPLESYSTNFSIEFRTLRAFIKIYKENGFDFIFHYTIKPNIYGTIAAAYCRIPSVMITTGLGQFLQFRKSLTGKLTVNMYRFAGWLAKEVWFLNEDDMNVFLKERITRKNKSVLLSSEGINTDWFSPNGYKKDYNEVRFLYAGRVLWDKGVGEFAEVARKLTAEYPNVKFQILGFVDNSNPNSVPRETLVQWQNEGVIQYLGEATDVRPYLERVDCLVFPSYYREGLSRILLEAASMGKPIITTDNVGCRDVVIDGETGYITQPKDIDELEDAARKILELSHAERREMGMKGREKVVREFNEKDVFPYYYKTIEKLMGKPLK